MKSLRFLMTILSLALVAGCATPKPQKVIEYVRISDYCTKDDALWFDHDETIGYLAAHEMRFLRDFVLHNEKNEKFCGVK